MSKPLRLGVNVDHVATIRNARGGPRPDPVRAALLAIEAGADGITAHLREDRRHISDADMARLKAAISKPLNFEMAATEQMLDIALATAPHAVCLVPEKRTERTTEGGLDVVGGHDYLVPYVDQLDARRHSRFALHRAVAQRRSTRPSPSRRRSWSCIRAPGAMRSRSATTRRGRARIRAGRRRPPPMPARAGSKSMPAMASIMRQRAASRLPQVVELNIGHFLIGEAVFVGLAEAIRRMRGGDGAGPGVSPSRAWARRRRIASAWTRRQR